MLKERKKSMKDEDLNITFWVTINLTFEKISTK